MIFRGIVNIAIIINNVFIEYNGHSSEYQFKVTSFISEVDKVI